MFQALEPRPPKAAAVAASGWSWVISSRITCSAGACRCDLGRSSGCFPGFCGDGHSGRVACEPRQFSTLLHPLSGSVEQLEIPLHASEQRSEHRAKPCQGVFDQDSWWFKQSGRFQESMLARQELPITAGASCKTPYRNFASIPQAGLVQKWQKEPCLVQMRSAERCNLSCTV